MSGVPGTYRNRRGTALFLLATIPDDAPEHVKNGLAIRNACAVEGRCPACGTTPRVWVDRQGIGHATFEHEEDCPCLRDGEVAA